jgi:hypothetical protein
MSKAAYQVNIAYKFSIINVRPTFQKTGFELGALRVKSGSKGAVRLLPGRREYHGN